MSIFKRWWFLEIIIAVVIIIAIVGSGPNDSKPAELSSNTAVSDNLPSEIENKQEDKQNDKSEISKPESSSFVNTAVATELFAGEFIVGKDIKPGRYVITCKSGSGNLIVYDGGKLYINEILTSPFEKSLRLGVTKIEVDLKEGQVIKISGLNNVSFEPAVIEQKTTLPSGYHLVGRDVPAGNYIATAPQGSGNFIVYDKNGMPKVNEILGKDDFGLSVEKIKFSVKNGDVIYISGIEVVELNKLDNY